MNKRGAGAGETRLLVLDTNVLMHDPAALFRFAEHNVFLPMTVIEELDNNKKGLSEAARNVRQVSRFLDELIADRGRAEIEAGIALAPAGNNNGASGRLFLQTEPLEPGADSFITEDTPDNTILTTTLALAERHPGRVTLVSKDINLRIKAAVLGLNAEDYYNDKVLDDPDLLYRGIEPLAPGFFSQADQAVESWHDAGRTWYRMPLPKTPTWPNQFLCSEGEESMELWVREVGTEKLTAELAWDYRREHHAVWGVVARNQEQSLALNLLMDPEIDFVTLLGPAGTGKTLLALAAGLAQTLDDKRYREIIMTRVTVPLGEDIGFLPGTEEEKMTPWMGALMDNLEVLASPAEEAGSWGRDATQDLLARRIKIRSLNFMRGRTFLNRYIILDEAQNLTAKQLKALITRAGPGTKVVALGNIAQIDTPYLTETTSGLTYVVDRFKDWQHSGHITLQRVERSRLADHANEAL